MYSVQFKQTKIAKSTTVTVTMTTGSKHEQTDELGGGHIRFPIRKTEYQKEKKTLMYCAYFFTYH